MLRSPVLRRSLLARGSGCCAGRATVPGPRTVARFRLSHSRNASTTTKYDGGSSGDQQPGTEDADAASSEWIAPSRPLVGDLGQSHLYVPKNVGQEDDEGDAAALQRLEQDLANLEAADETTLETAGSATVTTDWLATRRARLMSLGMDAAAGAEGSFELFVRDRTLLSSYEIKMCLDSLGGRDLVVAETLPGQGYVLATGATPHLLRSMADTLVRHLRDRNLHKLGVVGAELGVEGDPGDTWLVVDAGNFVVHLQDAKTRRAVDLEALWFGRDNLKQVDAQDEEAVERYIAANPVPEDYNVSLGDWDATFKGLEKQKWTRPQHRPVVAKPKARSSSRRRIK